MAAGCEIRSAFCFLNAGNVLPSEIHHQTCQVYGDNAMSDGMSRKWVRMFNGGRENVHDEARSGRPSLVNDDFVRKAKNLCSATISASIIAANMWKISLKNVESDNNKILYETLLDFFLQRNGTYFLNKPRTLSLFSLSSSRRRCCW